MTNVEQAQRYIAKCRPAVSGEGGHNTTFALACWILNGFQLTEEEAYAVMLPWNETCQPPWKEGDLRHKVRDAAKAQHKQTPGHLLRSGGDRKRVPVFRPERVTGASGAAGQGQADDPLHDLPEPIEDETRYLLRTAFKPKEGVRIAPARLNEEGREVPDSGGICLTAEEWIKKLDKHKGNPNGIFRSSEGAGLYVGINPYKEGCTKDADVTELRHALIEFDEGLSPHEQYSLYLKSNLPCSAIIYSGGKSVHAWVLVDAQDRKEYDERVKSLYDYFSALKLTVDNKNKNPGRLSRLPGCKRFDRRQELLAGRVGAANFGAWLADRELEGLGRSVTPQELLEFDYRTDPSTAVGQRYLCRGGSLVLVGPSGVGKSSLLMQMLVSLAVGRPFWGIRGEPGKVLLIQAENDKGDMAEMLQGVTAGMALNEFDAPGDLEILKTNMVFQHDCVHTGFEFICTIQKLIERHKPKYVAIDPLLSFMGADISKQEECSKFLRNWLNPISESTGVIWLIAHHTGKPPAAKAREGWTSTDHSYVGLGSSELVNWARAMMVLEPVGDGLFKLRLSKRGSRAGAKHPNDNPTTEIYLRHAQHGIHWDQVLPPAEQPTKDANKRGRHSKVERLMTVDLSAFIASLAAESLGKIEAADRLVEFAARRHLDVSRSTACNALERLVEARQLAKKGGFYKPGDVAFRPAPTQPAEDPGQDPGETQFPDYP